MKLKTKILQECRVNVKGKIEYPDIVGHMVVKVRKNTRRGGLCFQKLLLLTL